jgi:hypothetical protein
MTAQEDDELNDVWGGRLELRLTKDTGEDYAAGYRGAITTVLVRCRSAGEFIQAAAENLRREGFEIAGIEYLYPLSMGELEINDLIENLLHRTREYPVQWTTFHLFKPDA